MKLETTAGNEHGVFVASQRLMHRLLSPSPPALDELIFLEFRPQWLRRQRTVYNYLAWSTCAICMMDVHPAFRAPQHNPKHPPVCSDCFVRLRTCPFCRVTLARPRLLFVSPEALLRLWSRS